MAAALIVASGSVAQAQTRRASMLPAEPPPADYAEAQYVDSRGCAFVRAGSNGQVTWLPLFGDDREPVCGLRPSAEAAPPQPSRVVVREPPPVAEPEPEREPETATAEPAGQDAPATTAPITEAAPANVPADAPVVIAEAPPQPASPRHALRVIARRGTIVVVPADPHRRSVLHVVDRRGQLFYPDA